MAIVHQFAIVAKFALRETFETCPFSNNISRGRGVSSGRGVGEEWGREWRRSEGGEGLDNLPQRNTLDFIILLSYFLQANSRQNSCEFINDCLRRQTFVPNSNYSRKDCPFFFRLFYYFSILFMTRVYYGFR